MNDLTVGIAVMMSSSPTLVAGRYRLVQLLGAGGMGRVWHAWDEILGRDVAIKEIVPPDQLLAAERDELRRRTLREARAAARLSHPNVVRVYDVFEAEGRPWIVMEYVRSRSLQEVLAADGPLDPLRAAAIGLGLLGALRAAHRAGVLHRDIKPSNVLLCDDGRVVLTDFGIATVEGDAAVTRTGLVLGSPAYIAPERAREGSAGPESDLWSLGATLYAAVEGRSPYERPSAMATLAALAAEEPDPPRNAGPLRPTLNGLLRKDPAARITAAEAERRLRRAATPGAPPARRFRWPWTGRFEGTDQGVPRQRSGTEPPPPVAPPPVAPGPSSSPAVAPAGPESPTVEPAPGETAVVGPAPAEPASAEAPQAVAPAETVVVGPAPAETAPPQQVPDDSAAVEAASGGSAAAEAGAADSASAGAAPDATRTRRRSLIVVAALAAVAALMAGWVVLSDSWPSRTAREPDPGRAATSQVPSPEPAPSAAPPSESAPAGEQPGQGAEPEPEPRREPDSERPPLPDGWRLYTDDTGFSVYVPADWRITREGTLVYFRGDGRVLGIDQRDDPQWDPVADWTRQRDARRAAGEFPGYSELRLEPVDYGLVAADWEFTFDGRSGVRQHVNNRGVVVSETKAYGFWWQTTHTDWEAAQPALDLVFSSFRPASGA
jgi:predicted Ser/Thr protein kinase